ncbi:MAG: inositol monophosphatase [Acidobacteria bacterium]|nr:inositol monophosphatase [Acidobacteriota bacterium]
MPQYLEAAVEIAREAGALLLPFYSRGVRVEYKGEVDIVTEADRASEALIINRLNGYFPGHAIVAEEGGGHSGKTGYRWYVDPLDGTTNFAHTFPMFCVSMGLEKDDELIAGVIYDPLRDELFSAEKNGGARFNNDPLHVSRVGRLEEALVATGFPSNKRHKSVNIHFYHQISMRSHGVRRAGSAALDLAYVAAGRLDCFWEFHLHAWDIAAGKLIIQEAGGEVTDMHGGPHHMESSHIAASNGCLHAPLIEAFDEVFAGVYRVKLPEIQKPEVRS